MAKDMPYTFSWFIGQFEGARDEAGELIAHTDDSLLLQRPAPEKWSAVECLSHLVEFGYIYFAVIKEGISQAQPSAISDERIFKPRVFWRWVIRFFEPPYKIRMKTIESFKPPKADQKSPEQVLDAFSLLQKRFIGQIKDSREKGIDLSVTKVSHPVLSFLKMTLSECLAITEAHQRRHLWQAKQTIAALKKKG